jgi:Holliday junction resolvase RusA-like endonuclease
MKYEIPFKLPSLNDYIRVCRSNKYQGAKYKAHIEEMIGKCLTDMPKWTKPIKIHFHWVEGNKRRDLDNVAFSKKFILDAMVKFEKLNDDNRKYVYAFTDTFEYGDKTKVILEVEECDNESLTI